jgi:dCMP deaminase
MQRSELKDNVFMEMAVALAKLGTCCRLQVGCVLLRSDGGIASAGFNGALPGMAHCTPDTCGPNQRCLHTSHAEENALGFSSGEVATAYITHEPCLACTRGLARRGVRRIVFKHRYSSMNDQERAEKDAILAHLNIAHLQLSNPEDATLPGI